MTPDQLAQLLDVEHRWAFRMKTVLLDGKPVPQTECNDYLGVFAAGRGVRIPGGLSANQLVTWLSEQAAGGTDEKLNPDAWTEYATEAEARTASSLPELFVCAAMTEEGHGHVAPLLPPSADAPGVTRVSAAGIANFNATALVHSFGQREPGVVRFFGRPLPPT